MNIEDFKLRLEFLKENFEYQDFFEKFLQAEKELKGTGVWPGLGFALFGLHGFRYYSSHNIFRYEEILDMINPEKDTNDIPEKYIKLLPRLFYEPAVSLIEPKGTKNSHLIDDVTMGGCLEVYRHGQSLEIWERMYKVDLRKKRQQIKKEFESYLDRALKNYPEDNTRQRAEGWKQLEVWRLRKEKIDFPEIAKTLNCKIDTAKKRFYRACERSQGKPYDPEILQSLWVVKKSNLQQPCDVCPKRNTCTSLCPEMLKYVEQDHAKQTERILSDLVPNGTSMEDFRDYLTSKNS